MIRVLITDDHVILRRGLKEILARQLPGAACGEAKNAGEVLAQVGNFHWDIAILNISMPGRGGLDILADLKREQPKVLAGRRYASPALAEKIAFDLSPCRHAGAAREPVRPRNEVPRMIGSRKMFPPVPVIETITKESDFRRWCCKIHQAENRVTMLRKRE